MEWCGQDLYGSGYVRVVEILNLDLITCWEMVDQLQTY